MVSIVISSRDGGDENCIIEHWIPAGDSVPLHAHRREDEIFHILEGTLRFRVGEDEFIASSGETILAPKGIPHSYRVESASGAHCLTTTRGHDFETMVATASRPARLPSLPKAAQPTPEEINALVQCCKENHIEILGPPLT